MTGLRGRARRTLALGAAVTLVAAGVLTWVAVSGDDEWHGGEPGVVVTPATPGGSTASTPSPPPTGPEPVFPAPQQTPAPTGTPGVGDPSPTDDRGEPGVLTTPATPGGGTANTPSPLPTGTTPVSPDPQQSRDGTPTDNGGGHQQGTAAPPSGSPSGGPQPR